MDQPEDGQQFKHHGISVQENPVRIVFVCSVNNDQAEEVFTHNKGLKPPNGFKKICFQLVFDRGKNIYGYLSKMSHAITPIQINEPSYYYNIFGEPPKQRYTAPIENGDHPEGVNSHGISTYQSLIGALQ